jgi:hypothetical protein
MFFADPKSRRLLKWLVAILAPVAVGVFELAKVLLSPTQGNPSVNGSGNNQVVTSGNNNSVNSSSNNSMNFTYFYYGFSKAASADLNRIQDQNLGSNTQQTNQNFTFTLKGCLATQPDAVSCPITVENYGPDRMIFLGGQSNENYIIDEAGLTHTIRAIQLGSSHNNPAQTMAPNGIPIRGVVSYGGDGQTIQGKISRLVVNVSLIVRWFPVKWDDVQVSR